MLARRGATDVVGPIAIEAQLGGLVGSHCQLVNKYGLMTGMRNVRLTGRVFVPAGHVMMVKSHGGVGSAGGPEGAGAGSSWLAVRLLRRTWKGRGADPGLKVPRLIEQPFGWVQVLLAEGAPSRKHGELFRAFLMNPVARAPCKQGARAIAVGQLGRNATSNV